MLSILLATCEAALQAFAVKDDAVDGALVEDLENMVVRTRRELERLTTQLQA